MKFFNETDLEKKINELKDVQEKYDLFLMKYEQGVKEYVLFYKVKEKGKKEWFNGKCERAKKRRDEAWRIMKRKPIQKRKEYKLERNEYVRVRREENRYEKDIVDKCKEEPKLFYRFINGKIKQRKYN